MTSKGRFKRSCLYAIVAVGGSALAILILLLLGTRTVGHQSGTNATDIAAYILGLPLRLDH
jgi:hypothetical protein